MPDLQHSRNIFFLGGNGHCAARIAAARRSLTAQTAGALVLCDFPYPGFEGRPRAASLDDFLEAVAGPIEAAGETAAVYCTGIGGLFLLCLRARGRLLGVPAVMQGAVLWGLETRAFPKAMRALPLLPGAARSLFRYYWFQERFLAKHFREPLSAEMRALFFDGYARCAAFEDQFRWLTPGLLRELESAFRADPAKLDGIHAWWGDGDTVVGLDELRVTEARLGHTFSLRTLPGWGHYPYLDDPEGWAAALAEEFAPDA